MSTSLLSLPDELLDIVIDQALGEYAPRLYKERQRTCRALSLVNKRVGGIAKVKLVEVVHALAFTPFGFQYRLKPEQAPDTSCVRALWLDNVGLNCPADGYLSFAAVRDLRLKDFHGVRLEDLSQLPGASSSHVRAGARERRADLGSVRAELRTLVLAQGDIGGDKPLIAPKLERLVLYFCDTGALEPETPPFAAAGCPALQHLHLGVSMPVPSRFCAPDLVEAVDTLGVELLDFSRMVAPWSSLLGTDERSRMALYDKAFFDLMFVELEDLHLHEPFTDIRHLRLHICNASATCLAAYEPAFFADLPDKLPTLFPSLKSLYLPLAFDPACVMLNRSIVDAVNELAAACARMRALVVFEHDLEAAGLGEDRASPHFEARCRRIKAEQAAAQGAQVQLGGARAA